MSAPFLASALDAGPPMKRVAIFGNTGGGKSTLARRLAELTRLPFYPLDLIQFRAGGRQVTHEGYVKAHADLLRKDEWIIEGFGDVASAWERFSRADTLIYIDLPLVTHYWRVTKRLIKAPCKRRGLAGKQPDVEEHHQQLQGGMELPSPVDAERQAACRRCGEFEAGSPPQMAGRDADLPRRSQT